MAEHKPFLIAWNLTRRCNLRCAHCYLSAGERDAAAADELTLEESLRVVNELAAVNPAALLVLTGGEPLLRRDLPDIARYATQKGMMVVVGTNGTLLSDAKVRDLRNAGVMGLSISLDSLDPEKHDGFRGFPGALEGAMNGIEACRRNGMPFQIHTTAGRMNYEEIPSLLDWACQKEAKVFNLFFLVCTGRGETMSDITPEQYEKLLADLLDVQERYPGMLIRSRCAPHFKRLAYQRNPDSPITRARGYEGGGCLAGTHYARITPAGDLTPCPFIPLSVGNLRGESFADLWDSSPVFRDFRKPRLGGRCGECEYAVLCGGCRARPFADHTDYLDEDPWCLYSPQGGPVIQPLEPADLHLIWTKEARERLSRLPYFLQEMIKGQVERKAMEAGRELITVEWMEELRRNAFGNGPPVFDPGLFRGKGLEPEHPANGESHGDD